MQAMSHSDSAKPVWAYRRLSVHPVTRRSRVPQAFELVAVLERIAVAPERIAVVV